MPAADAAVRACTAVYDRCQAAPGTGGSTRATCYACGQPACLSCTIRTGWYGRRRRVCFDCLQDAGQGRAVADRLWRAAGYHGRAPERLVVQFQPDPGTPTAPSDRG